MGCLIVAMYGSRKKSLIAKKEGWLNMIVRFPTLSAGRPNSHVEEPESS